MKPTLSRLIAAGTLFLTCHFSLAAEPSLFSLQLSKTQHIRGLKIPLGMQGNSKPTASVYFGEISIESKKAGFLRIGPIPQLVVTGMRLDILGAEGGTGWCADFARFAANEASFEHAQIRGLEIRSIGSETFSIRAEGAQFIQSSRTLQLRGVQVQTEGRVLHIFAAGEVHLEGEKAGQLEWSEGGRTRSIALSGLPAAQDGGIRLMMR